MRLVIQRVKRAAVSWTEAPGERREEIGQGLLVLLGAAEADTAEDVRRLAQKVAELRIFADEQRRSNLSLSQVQGEALVVSQFTLYADLSRGRRPSFLKAGNPERAQELCDRFADDLSNNGIAVKRGRFGAHMTVALENDGPVTLVLSSDDWMTKV